MRVGLALLCLSGVAAAEPAIPALRPMPSKATVSVARYWARARLAEKRGRLGDMYRAFTDAARESKEPDSYFNAAVVAMRAKARALAQNALEDCLRASPPDRRPAVQALLDEMRKVPPRVTIASAAPATVVIGHKIVGPAPLTARLAPGDYDVEVFTRDGVGVGMIQTHVGEDLDDDIDATPGTGNVYLTGFKARSWTQGTKTFLGEQRFQLPVGSYSANPQNPDMPPVLCTPVRFEVKSAQDVTYVHVEVSDKSLNEKGCYDVVKVTQLAVKLP